MKRVGFTLIELLVVITIIVVLIGVLMPVLHAIRQRTRIVVCASNLKQLSLALSVYDQENESFPYGFDDSRWMVEPPGGYVGNATYDKMGWWWFHFLAGSLGENFDKETIIWCPSRSIKDPLPKANVLCGNYGVNRTICMDAPGISGVKGSEFVGKPLSSNQICRPAETLLITDSGYSLISWRGATNTSAPSFENIRREDGFYVPGLWINKERVICSGCERDAIDGRHLNKSVNVGFADGHISCLGADDLFVEGAGGSYSNLTPLWQP